jgi:hypothetical protein
LVLFISIGGTNARVDYLGALCLLMAVIFGVDLDSSHSHKVEPYDPEEEEAQAIMMMDDDDP